MDSPCATSSSSVSELLNLESAVTVSHKKTSGRKKFQETRHPIYRGVRKRNGCKWVCEVREPNSKKSRIWLGTHYTAEMAARAHDVAALALRGESASLNFADSAWLLPRPNSVSAIDIRTTAYEAAQAFAPVPLLTSPVASLTELPAIELLVLEPSTPTTFWDEEAMFSVPNFLNNMAEGLLLAPPGILDWEAEMALWPNY